MMNTDISHGIALQKKKDPKGDFFDYNFQELITMGINEKAIFVAYPKSLIGNDSENDKLSSHNFCNNNHTFVQNAYYDRGLEQFTDDIIVHFIKGEFKKREIVTAENIIYFPCFPENYWELMSNIEVYGSGNYEECKQLIEEYIKAKSNEKINSPFGFSYPPTWPLEDLNSEAINSIQIVLESDIIKQILTQGVDDDKKTSQIFTGGELEKEIENVCKTMFETEKSQNFF